MANVTQFPPSGWPEGRPAGTSPDASDSAAGSGSAAAPIARARSAGGYLGGRDGDVQEVERVLSHVAAARDRTEQARRVLLRNRANPELIEALAECEEHLRDAQRRLVGSLDTGAPDPLATA